MTSRERPPSFIPPDLTVPRAVPSGPPYPPEVKWNAGHKYVKQLERLRNAIDTFSRRVAVNPSSRIVRWVAALERLERVDKRSVLTDLVEHIQQSGDLKHPFRDAFVALMESRSFIEIVEQLIDYLADHDLQELVKGSLDPAEDKQSARARNKEFEWYIASLFRRAGLPVALAEPDVLIHYNGSVRAIAAKRVYSRNKLKENVKNATDQIKRAGLTGYIFLEVTRYINPDMLHIEHWRRAGTVVEPRMHALATSPDIIPAEHGLVNAVFIRAAFPLISPAFEYGTCERWNVVGLRGELRDENMLLLHVLHSGLRGV